MVNKVKVSSRRTEWTSIRMPEPPPRVEPNWSPTVLDDELPVSLVAAAAGVCPRTVRTWVARYQAEGPDGLADRSSRPHRQPRTTPTHIVAQWPRHLDHRGPGRRCSAT